MPRMTLRAAAMSLLFAAWSMPAVMADDQPVSKSSTPSAKKSGEQESGKRRFTLPFGKKSDEAKPEAKPAPKPAPVAAKKVEAPKGTALARLKQAVGLDSKEEKNKIVQAQHQAPAQRTAALSENTIKARTAAYNDAEPLPAAGDPVPPVAPVGPVAGPAIAPPGAPLPVTGPGYAPVPVPNYAAGHAVLPGYPYLNAPLNPTPVPNVPYQMGSTIITNQALYPHELQYPHEYKAMYPPFYYKVRGGWMVTPWGVWSHDRWELQGTEVKVKYRSHYSIQSMFTPPCVR